LDYGASSIELLKPGMLPPFVMIELLWLFYAGYFNLAPVDVNALIPKVYPGSLWESLAGVLDALALYNLLISFCFST